MRRSDLVKLGLEKLAEGAGFNTDPQEEWIHSPPPAAAPNDFALHINPFKPPTPSETASIQGYNQAGILGTLGGGATGVLLGSLAKRNPLAYGALGAGAGLVAGLLRHYDQKSDPPGLSPVYTVPSGLRLGALTGAGLGAVIGRATGLGIVPGLLAGLGSGTVGGGIVSGMV